MAGDRGLSVWPLFMSFLSVYIIKPLNYAVVKTRDRAGVCLYIYMRGRTELVLCTFRSEKSWVRMVDLEFFSWVFLREERMYRIFGGFSEFGVPIRRGFGVVWIRLFRKILHEVLSYSFSEMKCAAYTASWTFPFFKPYNAKSILWHCLRFHKIQSRYANISAPLYITIQNYKTRHLWAPGLSLIYNRCPRCACTVIDDNYCS